MPDTRWKSVSEAPDETLVLIWAKGYQWAPVAKRTFVDEDTGWIWLCEDDSLFEYGTPSEDLGYEMPTHFQALPDPPEEARS